MSDEITPEYMKAIAAVAKDAGLDNCAQCIAIGAAALERCAELTNECNALHLANAGMTAATHAAEERCAELERQLAEQIEQRERSDAAIFWLQRDGDILDDPVGAFYIEEAITRHAIRQQPGDAGESNERRK